MRAGASSLGIAPLDLPWAEGLRLWRAEVIGAHLPYFKGYAPVAGLLAKAGAWDESKHPRVPAGSREGGQFQSGQGGAGSEGQPAAPGIGHNAGPPLQEPPQIPPVEPLTEPLRNAFAKLAARWLARAVANAAFGPEGEFLTILEAAAETALWLYDKIPLIKAYLDGPKSLEDLQADVGKPGKGYDVHHIVEQTPAEREGHGRAIIDGPDNLVRIPTLKHWEVTGWLMTPNADYNDLSPREFLKRKSWEKRREVGIKALIETGVLKP
ncbi:MAG: hypothetical protein ACREDT_06250 [Methylocella sp.]